MRSCINLDLCLRTIAIILYIFTLHCLDAGHTNVVERVVLEALLRQQLLPYFTSAKAMQLSRCGRTDQQVSGLSQVVTVKVRSNLDEGLVDFCSNC